ncbi:sugar phosphate isomerase/epimerase family protein [Pseudactinotalea suaedae]|uniref:sugar phosphate isomerase/epimerase family protein n=1 Tax=Pseudactinotalea suaedae TaxID=1524924 RepID=UPI0012E22988|nr:sugar phosphate isomerase/epimerase family protein [Pseudactinotalea suaedae]
MWTLSGFADEIGPDLNDQLEVVVDLGLSYIELRSVWDVNVLDLSDAQRAEVAAALADRGIRVSSIGSPIGKIAITDDFAPHLDRMRHCVEVAQEFEAPYIRLFSFFMPAGGNPADHRDEVMRRMSALAEIGGAAGIAMVHENEKEIYGDIPARCLDIVQTVDNEHLQIAWDAANFVQCGVRPFSQGYTMLRPHLTYVQIKDALLAEGTVVPAGAGDGEVRETIRALREDGFDGFFSLEPHLAAAGPFGGFSGPDLWRTAHEAFTRILTEEGIAFA